jgi:hypothetical protein
MDVFTKLFGELLVFVYHCFDRIVIHGYLTALLRPELVVRFFRDIVGVVEVSKEALSQRTADYQRWVEAYERRDSGQNDLFRARLDQIVDLTRPLAKLGTTIGRRFLEERFGAVYSDRPGHRPLPKSRFEFPTVTTIGRI